MPIATKAANAPMTTSTKADRVGEAWMFRLARSLAVGSDGAPSSSSTSDARRISTKVDCREQNGPAITYSNGERTACLRPGVAHRILAEGPRHRDRPAQDRLGPHVAKPHRAECAASEPDED